MTLPTPSTRSAVPAQTAQAASEPDNRDFQPIPIEPYLQQAQAQQESEYLGGATPYVDVDWNYPVGGVPKMGPKIFIPKYRQGNEWNDPDFGNFARLQRETIIEIQEQMAWAGLFGQNIGDLHVGRWDPLTANAMADLMGYANNAGFRDWREALNHLGSTTTPNTANLMGGDGAGGGGGGGAGGAPQFTPEPYLAPDYDTLVQSVKSTMRDQLRRDPRDFEIQMLADAMREDHRAAYQAEMAAARAQFEAGIGARSPDNYPELTQVDLESSFQERFEDLFGGEIDRLEREGDVREAQRGLIQSVAGLRNLG